jgi:hypothetical protein
MHIVINIPATQTESIMGFVDGLIDREYELSGQGKITLLLEYLPK